jgi:hypothetical protein
VDFGHAAAAVEDLEQDVVLVVLSADGGECRPNSGCLGFSSRCHAASNAD